MKLHAYSEPFGSVSYHFVDDCDEELMDQWSLIKVIEWHNFFLLSPRDTKSHHGTVTMNISKMVLSSFPSFLWQFLCNFHIKGSQSPYFQYSDGIDIPISMSLTFPM